MKEILFNDELELFFQPQIKYNANSREEILYGVECLLRLKNRNVNIEKFIKEQERKGNIDAIGNIIIDLAIKEYSYFQKNDTLKNIKISINVSPIQIKSNSLTRKINSLGQTEKDILTNIYFEITESGKLTNGDFKIIKKLEECGYRFILDDFGTGETMYNLIEQDINWKIIKIDKFFVRNMNKNKNALIILETMTNIAKNNNSLILVEGVEVIEELDVLLDMGIRKFQGYLFSRPLSKEDLLKYVSSSNKLNHKKLRRCG